ncbi:glycosyltransferase [Halocatena halophila]|uniref:glycosyltransferase n=1 Tax=Halocatena halophila TaxID=2814576 RepID=UPI002ED0B78D
MEVKTVEETSLSLRRISTYALITGVLVTGVLLPIPYVEGYGSLLNTILLLGLVGLVGRTVVSAVIAFSRSDPPSIPEDTELPSVSVVIPAYNEEPVLGETIEACKRVDYPEEKLEVVLCYEASSTDRTAAIANAAAKEDSRFKAVVRDEPGGGKAKATNYALQYATGDIIASIDADHKFKPNAIRRAVAWFLEDEDTWCVKGRCYGDNPTDSVLALHATVERHIAEKADLFAREVVDGFTIFGGGQAFFRAEVFDELGEFDEEILVEDIDMSSKIHQIGKELKMDPHVITYEENPATLDAWWNQRKRWARGWMQVAVRYLPLLPQEAAVSTRKKVDAVYTFVYAIVPVLFVLVFPMPLFQGLQGVTTASFIPGGWAIWSAISVAPVVVSYLVFMQDWLDGETHHWREYLAAFTLWFYLIFQTVVFIAAFIDEFILDRESIYVTTSRSGQSQPR